MPGVRIRSLVAIGTLRRLSWGGEENAALRTTHSFTLGERLNELTSVDVCCTVWVDRRGSWGRVSPIPCGRARRVGGYAGGACGEPYARVGGYRLTPVWSTNDTLPPTLTKSQIQAARVYTLHAEDEGVEKVVSWVGSVGRGGGIDYQSKAGWAEFLRADWNSYLVKNVLNFVPPKYQQPSTIFSSFSAPSVLPWPEKAS